MLIYVCLFYHFSPLNTQSHINAWLKDGNSSILIFFQDNLEHFFLKFLLLDFHVIIRNQRLIKYTPLSHIVLYILTISHQSQSSHDLFFFFFHKVPLRQPHFCVNITVKIFILFAIAQVAQIYFFLFVINWEVATQFHALQILSKRQSWKEGSTGVKKVRLCY